MSAPTWELYTNTVNAYCYYTNVFDNDMIDGIIQLGSSLESGNAKIGGDMEVAGGVDSNVRVTSVSWIPTTEENAWLYRMLTDITLRANSEWFEYDLAHIESLQYSVYDVGGFYSKHIDNFYQAPGKMPRKLSFVLQLSDPSEYEGGQTMMWNGREPWPIPQDKGTITFFPSYTLHEVTPITKGTRKALVGWVHGPRLK